MFLIVGKAYFTTTTGRKGLIEDNSKTAIKLLNFTDLLDKRERRAIASFLILMVS